MQNVDKLETDSFGQQAGLASRRWKILHGRHALWPTSWPFKGTNDAKGFPARRYQGHRGMFLANKATFTSCKRRARTARVTRQQGGHVSARSSMLWPNIQSETSGRTEDSAVTSREAFALCECSKFVRETSDG